MIKALLKKQIIGWISYFSLGKNGKKRSPMALIGFALLMVYVLWAVSSIFYGMGKMLCVPLAEQGMAWVYFALMGTFAVGFGVIGSIFTVKSKLYEAKDNDLLLSMPIPSWLILCSRMIGLYFFTLLFEGLVFVPAVIAFFAAIGFSMPVLIGSLFVLLLMPFGTLFVCCLLGWLIALATAKLPAKNLVTYLFSVAALALYFFLYSKLNEYLGYVIANGEAVSHTMKSVLYPFGQLGLACTGEGLALLIFGGIFFGVFALVYALLSATYIRLVTANKGGKKAKYKQKMQKEGSWFGALFKKELRRYTKNAMIAMNCFLGSLFLVVAPLLLLSVESVREIAAVEGIDGVLALIAAVALCAISSMNILSSISVSLEGESLWIVRSLPIRTEKILFTKAAFHFLLTAVPALFGGVFLCIYLKIQVWLSLALVGLTLVFIAFLAVFGLVINLKLPNLQWTNELSAIKQSVSSMIGMFAGWGAELLLVGGYFLFGKYLFAGAYLLICIALLGIVGGLLVLWLKKRGKEIFESL